MPSILLITLCFLLLPGFVFSGYNGFKWDCTAEKVRRACPKIKKVNNQCYFEGVNIFGKDSLVTYEDHGAGENVKKRTFAFYKKRLIAVDVQYDNQLMDYKIFKEKLVERLKVTYGADSMRYTEQKDNTKANRYFVWRLKNDVIVAVYGHFLGVSPYNLDWIRVRYYKREFYNFKNNVTYVVQP
jgi:hypothetical protein